jgi:putative transposase
LSREIVNEFGSIAVEDLNVRGLARTRLAKSIHDAAWASFIDKLAYKAESAGREFVKVNPSGTSQMCLCGASVPKTMKDRWHECAECGLSEPRDFVSAMLIERLGRSRQALTVPIGAVACGAEA